MTTNYYLTVTEAAEVMHCNPETIRRQCRDGVLKHSRLSASPGSAYRIPLSALMPPENAEPDIEDLLA